MPAITRLTDIRIGFISNSSCLLVGTAAFRYRLLCAWGLAHTSGRARASCRSRVLLFEYPTLLQIACRRLRRSTPPVPRSSGRERRTNGEDPPPRVRWRIFVVSLTTSGGDAGRFGSDHSSSSAS